MISIQTTEEKYLITEWLKIYKAGLLKKSEYSPLFSQETKKKKIFDAEVKATQVIVQLIYTCRTQAFSRAVLLIDSKAAIQATAFNYPSSEIIIESRKLIKQLMNLQKKSIYNGSLPKLA